MNVEIKMTQGTAKRLEYFLRMKYNASDKATLADLIKTAALVEAGVQAQFEAHEATLVMNLADNLQKQLTVENPLDFDTEKEVPA